MMDTAAVRVSYCAGRRADAAAMRELVRDFEAPEQQLRHVFWDNAVLGDDGGLETFYAPLDQKKKFTALSFDPVTAPPEIRRTADFAYLRVNSHRVLELGEFSGPEAFFAALSRKNRKKLRWLRNAVPAQGIRFAPLETPEQFAMFARLYGAQFPKYPPDSADNTATRRIYGEFHRLGRSFSFLLLAPDGAPLAASLSYLTADSCFFTHLTRARGEYDKFSPGYYLTYRVISELLTAKPEIRFFFMGAGDYDYKRAFLGAPLAIYRFERRSLRNLPGLLRLRFRLRKELRAWTREAAERAAARTED